MAQQPLLTGEDGRANQMQAANVQLLAQLCHPGDFLSSKIRTCLVRETLQATVTCQACRQLQEGQKPSASSAWDTIVAAPHSFHEPESCYGLGVIVHALANTQNFLKEDWYHKAVEHLWAVLHKLGEVPPEAKAGPQEALYRMTELIACVALAVGHRTFYRTLGKEPILDQPPLPSPRDYANGGAPMFKSAQEVSTQLRRKEGCGWGPCLDKASLTSGLKLANGELLADCFTWQLMPQAPTSKWTPALSTGQKLGVGR
ncbi:unnamed protein product [Symbiodinium natans]|uniref:Uncharacterized protein n=1 Tax=Symbiodinium natans TaxID=878477 RepID=A0A812JGH9_9DINO|nr:unnamed protein product [Symbiodinium natans]